MSLLKSHKLISKMISEAPRHKSGHKNFCELYPSHQCDICWPSISASCHHPSGLQQSQGLQLLHVGYQKLLCILPCNCQKPQGG